MTDSAFASLAIPQAQLDNLGSLGYHSMTAIQAAALPLALAGKDLVAQAKTGSGKTAAFGLPLLARLNPRDFGTQALILCPTRELASQVAAEIRRLARYQQNIKVVTLCGGQSIGPQIGSLEHGAHVVVGTPGRIGDHLRKNTLSLDRVNCVVLDEADRMLEMGFVDDIEAIIGHTPSVRQTLLFSATFPDNILAMSARFQQSPQRISVESQHDSPQIDQHFYICQSQGRLEGLAKLLAHYRPDAAVVFCNTKQLVREVCLYLEQQGVSAMALHGDMEQRDRDQVLVRFRQQACRVLVATDVAARGLDIDELPAVVNFELPRSSEIYVHRIGRTGRAGRGGLALSLFTDAERYRLDGIADLQQREVTFEAIDTVAWSDSAMPPPAFVTLCIAGGRRDKVRPGDVLGALTGEAGIDGAAVGKINVMDGVTYVAISTDLADTALGRLLNGKIKGRKFKVRRL
ncbi:MAG: ATP-dependent RNA helicase DbpA [Halioglobus sp.]|nr:ATP-dependent RNA helicase DbpA [Halioglobus sp.]